MTRIAYIEWNAKPDSLEKVDIANRIIASFQAKGYTLTLRQLYYQFVAHHGLENTERAYKALGNLVTNARMAGLLSWRGIEDRNRGHHAYWFEEDETVPVQELPDMIRFDRWARQPYYVEVWVEKEALGNVISKACEPWHVPYLSCKGYLSASEAWRAGMRYSSKLKEGKDCVLIHLGDHDPSGIDMTRDNRERLDLFSETIAEIDVRRIALNMNQVEEFNPPPNPAKKTDSRHSTYIRHYGATSWELDAMEPEYLEGIIQSEIRGLIDGNSWTEVGEQEAEMRATMGQVYERWDDIKALIDE